MVLDITKQTDDFLEKLSTEDKKRLSCEVKHPNAKTIAAIREARKICSTSTQNISYLHRIQSIDLLRGLIILIMALDHVRDFFGPTLFNPTDLSQTTPALFFTRWITHLCAPTFVWLTGVSAYLYGKKRTKRELSLFLVTRGIWLIFLEIFVISFSWELTAYFYMFLQVLWALGVSMVVLAALIWLPVQIVFILSIVTICGHNALDYLNLPADHTPLGIFWLFIHHKPSYHSHLNIIYSIFPWPGVIALGYCLGTWFERPVNCRNKYFCLLGLGCLLLFLIVRYLNGYGDPSPWQAQARGGLYTFLSFINVTKYPPSLLYLLLTLGIVFLLWPIYEKWQGVGKEFVLCFGKVALFFYLIHVPIIHIGAILYSHYFLHYPGGWWAGITSYNSLPYPPHYQLNLTIVYIAWLLLIAVTYPLCLLYKKYKSTHRYWWLSYL